MGEIASKIAFAFSKTIKENMHLENQKEDKQCISLLSVNFLMSDEHGETSLLFENIYENQ